jgi:hypothetical protein
MLLVILFGWPYVWSHTYGLGAVISIEIGVALFLVGAYSLVGSDFGLKNLQVWGRSRRALYFAAVLFYVLAIPLLLTRLGKTPERNAGYQDFIDGSLLGASVLLALLQTIFKE